MEIRLNTEMLISNQLTISEYLYLKLLYTRADNPEMYKVLDQVEDDVLQIKGYIRILEGKIVLRPKALQLFESANMFDKFLVMFPVKSPEGRFLSPLRSDTIKGKVLKKKWNDLFKNKPHLEVAALAVLEAELKWRRTTGKMEFIHAADVWLNRGDYENYAYLLEGKSDTNTRDLM